MSEHILRRYRERIRKMHEFMARRAAPLTWATTGTDESMMHNLGGYLDRLEALAEDLRTIVGDHCASHREPDPTCAYCFAIRGLREVGK